MPIKNYTTKVPANRSMNEIQDSLVKHGATGFMLKYEKGTGKIEALQFILEMPDGNSLHFQMPINWKLFQNVLKEQRVSRWSDEDYCYRVAWRVIRDWVMSQMALYETRMVSLPQIFLPYAITKKGNTVFEELASNPQLLLK